MIMFLHIQKTPQKLWTFLVQISIPQIIEYFVELKYN
jgi:hypothetical protein